MKSKNIDLMPAQKCPSKCTKILLLKWKWCLLILPFIDESEKLRRSVKLCTLGIEGMTCHSCVSLIESTVGEMKGVMKVTVSLEERQGMVQYNSALVTPEEIKNTVEDMGFIVARITGIVNITGCRPN